MSRHRAYWPLDDAPQPERELAWRGVNNRLQPSALPEGMAAEAGNMRFATGRPSTRKGARINAWAANRQPGDADEVIRPFGPPILAAGTFSHPINGFDWQIIVTGDAAYRVRPGNNVQTIPVESGQSLAGANDLLQTFDGLLLLRGRTAIPLHLTDLDVGFVALPEPDAGRVKMPPLTQAIYFQNRVIGVDGRHGQRYTDTFWVSDIGGATSVLQGEDAYQNFRINSGSADRLVAGYKFNDLTVIALKENSVHVVSNIAGTNEEIAANARLDTVTDEYGCTAQRSVVQVGRDVWFLGFGRGVVSITQTEQNKLQGVDLAKSTDVEGWIARINWQAASEACAASHDNHVYFAVPVDGAAYNNAVLVWSGLTQAWVSVDTGPAIKVNRWLKYRLNGRMRLGYVSTDGFIYLYEDGYVDHTGTGEGVISQNQIVSTFASRGYGRSEGFKEFMRWELGIRTWNPTYTLTIRQDGAHERRELVAVTRDRTAYMRPHGAANYDPSDPNDDWSVPYREDYSIAVPFAVREPAEGGAAFDVLQEVNESGQILEPAQWLQLELENTTGRVEIASMMVDPIRAATVDGVQS